MSCSFRFSFRFKSSFLFVASAPSSFFRFNSPLPFVTSFLSHKLLCPDRSVFPSVSTLPFYSLRLCLRINFCLARLALPFLSPCPFRCVHPFVSTPPSYLLFLSCRFNSHLTFQRKLEKNAAREKSIFFQVFKGGAIRAGICRPSSHLRPLAATCGHLP